ncbi:MAG: DNA-binding transcriptional regulator [Methylobacteriaceae bacterium]|nr:DNA-binding transcriptional regulator [Methylobacteriaceae bacterium]
MKRYRSRIAEAVHEAMADLHVAGAIDKQTMRAFDARCLTPVEELSPREIADLRRRAGVSQGVFAHYLNVKPKLVSEWERGEKKPSGPSLKLLALVKARGLEAIL